MPERKSISADYERLNVRTINWYLLILLTSLWLVYILADIIQGDLRIQASNTRLTLLLITIASNYFLSLRLHYKVSSAITLAALVISFLIYPSLPIGINIADVILLFFLVIVISVIPYLAYDIKLDRQWILGWIVVCFLTAMTSFSISLQKLKDYNEFDPLKQNVTEIFSDEPMILFAFFASYVFIHLLIYLNRLSNVKLLFQVRQANEELLKSIKTVKSQESKLAKRNVELLKLQQNLESINQNLEQIIQQQTKELKTKNDDLLRFAFMNSHLLRGPISRLEGLLLLRNSVNNEKLTLLFRSTVDELVETTSVIGSVVSKKADERDLNKIEKRVNQLYAS